MIIVVGDTPSSVEIKAASVYEVSTYIMSMGWNLEEVPLSNLASSLASSPGL